MTEQKGVGRPRRDGKDKDLYQGELYKLLQEKLPIRYRFYDGRIDTVKLAKDMGFARYSIYRWLNGERMRPASAQKLVKLSNEADCERKGALTLDMLTPFVLGI